MTSRPGPEMTVHSIARLPRGWWFPHLEGFRSADQATYVRYPLDEQPQLQDLDDRLSWLEEASEKTEWSIVGEEGGQAVRALTVEGLHDLAGDMPLPSSLRMFAGRPDLQRRIHSVTACYLDLGDFVVPTSNDGGHLLHLLSDQQWCRHWLLYADSDGNEAVVTSLEPLGFVLPDDWEDPPPEVVPMDGSYDIEVCADSFTEFLYRFWIENELWSALH